MKNNYLCFGEYQGLLKRCVEGRKVVFISDSNVIGFYPEMFEGQRTIIVQSGEGAKSVESYNRVLGELMEVGYGRETFLVGVGGGVVCDLVGFVGSTFMRGIGFGFIPTTLLAQVDAAIGGKNGINIEGYKNIAGCFVEPEFVIIDPLFLKTLPIKEYRSARGEVIKYALLFGEELLEKSNYSQICAQHKIGIVAEDFKDNGKRKLLNLGHTIAHALEYCYSKRGKGEISHGVAVGIGLCEIARLSNRMGMLEDSALSKVIALVNNETLPTEIPEDISRTEIIEAIKKDKKRSGDTIELVLLRGIGNPVLFSTNLCDFIDAYNQ